MNDRTPSSPLMFSIAAVERDTGLPKDTLRVWERRYGFPQPSRDAFGERQYSPDQVDKLRLVKRLMDSGHRPGRIVPLAVEDLQRLAQAVAPAPHAGEFAGHDEYDLRGFLDLVKAHEVEELRRRMSQALLRVGLATFVTEVVAPLNAMVGEAWTRGWFEIFEEHLYTESIQVILRNAINTIPQARRRPKVLLTTFPQEPHGLGLLMAEALFTLEGCRCVSLGVQTPVRDIARAAMLQQADVVALSFSALLNGNAVIDGLTELRAELPDRIEIWAGGACGALQRRAPDGILVIRALGQSRRTIEDWRIRADAS